MATNYEETLAGGGNLPDPLTRENGTPVQTAEEWMSVRRPELLRLFSEYVYGRTPPVRPPVRAEVFEESDTTLDGAAVRRQATLSFSEDPKTPTADVLLYLPRRAAAPSPLILALNFGGNHTIVSDPAVRLSRIWSAENDGWERAPESTRGSATAFAVEEIVRRGYGLATLCYNEIEPDFDGGYRLGIRPPFNGADPSASPPDSAWGAIGAWAFGLSCALDWLQTLPDVDGERVAVMGHSRLGKTALWAGAQDPRFAMVVSSCSGCGGAALARRNYGETVYDITTRFPHWFCRRFAGYADRTDELPVDMHELLALLAPRPVYVTGAEEDRWADPYGMFLACVNAGPVYRLLGADDLGTDQMPPRDVSIQRTIGFHCRQGRHEVTAFDWEQILAFADRHLRAPQSR